VPNRPTAAPRKWTGVYLKVATLSGAKTIDSPTNRGALLRIVVGELDAHRQALDDLDEVAGGVLRQQGEGLAGAHGEAADAALELLAAAVHVHLQLDALADAQVGELRLLEVGLDPDLGHRADRHQALADGDVVAGVDVAAGDHAVDFADHVGVAEVQFGLLQVAARLQDLGLGLLDGGRQGNASSKPNRTRSYGTRFTGPNP
jgi:hypothetical protein